MNHCNRLTAIMLAAGFLLGSFKGYLALWEGDDPEPKQIFPLAVSSLPPADQERVEAGIPLRNRAALERLLEDYLS